MALLSSVPVVYLFDWEKRTFLDFIQRTWATWTCLPFFEPSFQGHETALELAKSGEAVIYVSNHKSWADIYSLLCLPFPIRFISKQEIFYIPVCGWCMGLIGHIGVRRGDKSSRQSVVDTCVSKLKAGVSVFIFAEGTRSRDGYVQPFKKGAFMIAKESGAKIVPISINGTGALMPPNRGETWMESGSDAPVSIVFHEPIDPNDYASVNDLQDATKAVIESGITKY
jgi:1-acyl-sn-glycerol-3-phosphate acyltransferase